MQRSVEHSAPGGTTAAGTGAARSGNVSGAGGGSASGAQASLDVSLLFRGGASPSGDVGDAPAPTVQSADDVQAGAVLGQFRLVRQLGRGTSGAVWEATDTVLERTVALKVLPGTLSGRGPTALADFLREAHISSPLEHPNINTVFQAGKQGDVCYFVLEHSSRGSAADFVKENGRLAPLDAAKVAARAARGIEAVAEGGILHGHVCPQNILLAEQFGVRVSDFGLRTALERAGLVPDDAPADFYSPELCMGQGQDARSDVYSLGATLFFLLTGKPPFPGATRNAVMAGHMRTDPPDPRSIASDVPDGLAETCLAAMAKRPGDRPKSMGVLAAMLEGEIERLEDAARVARAARLAKAAKASVNTPLAPTQSTSAEMELTGDELSDMAGLGQDAPRAVPLPPPAIPWKKYALFAAGAVIVIGVGFFLFGGTPKAQSPEDLARKQQEERERESAREKKSLSILTGGASDNIEKHMPGGALGALPGMLDDYNRKVAGALDDNGGRRPGNPGGVAGGRQTHCPVCDRELEAGAVAQPWQGRVVMLCTPRCGERFDADPARYARKLPAR